MATNESSKRTASPAAGREAKEGAACCGPEAKASCCEPSDKGECCKDTETTGRCRCR